MLHRLLLKKVVMRTLLNLLSEVKMEGRDQVISLIQAVGCSELVTPRKVLPSTLVVFPG